MFKKLIELITEALRKMIAYSDRQDAIDDVDMMYSISEDMQDAITTWLEVYKDNSSWLDDNNGIYSLGLGKTICQTLQSQVMSEMESRVIIPGSGTDELDENTRAGYLNTQYQDHVLKHLGNKVEQAMAVGGMIFKPYVSGDKIYIDFCRQGNFIPIAFDDDGEITDIAFSDSFISDGFEYTKIERQLFSADEQRVYVTNKVYKAKLNPDNDIDELGTEVPIETIPRWRTIEPEVVIEDVDRPLFGNYRVPLANNIDLDCPLGLSVFSPALKMIKKADEQFSRLDWEYEGGQMAIDVDDSAINVIQGYYGTNMRLDQTRNRLYRTLDLGKDETYEAFAPTLRDISYIDGLDKYLRRIEDLVGLARGSLSEVAGDARTATEIRILKQRTYITIASNQKALDTALNELIHAMDILTNLYDLAPAGEFELVTDWKDSVLTDTNEELTNRLLLVDKGIISREEVREWYLDEDEDTAKNKIAEIDEVDNNNLMDDIFTQNRTQEGNQL